jgi:hypothetical protein
MQGEDVEWAKLDSATRRKWDTQTYVNKLAVRLDPQDARSGRRRGALNDCALAIAAEHPNGEKDKAIEVLKFATTVPKAILVPEQSREIAACLESTVPMAADVGGATAKDVLEEHGLNHGKLVEATSDGRDDAYITVRQGTDGFGVESVKASRHPEITARGGKFVVAAFRAEHGDEALRRATITLPDGTQKSVLEHLQATARFTVRDVRAIQDAITGPAVRQNAASPEPLPKEEEAVHSPLSEEQEPELPPPPQEEAPQAVVED